MITHIHERELKEQAKMQYLSFEYITKDGISYEMGEP